MQITAGILDVLQLNLNYIFSIFFLKKIVKMLNVIFEFPLNRDMKKVSRQLTTLIIIVFVIYFVFTFRIIFILWVFKDSEETKINVISLKEFNGNFKFTKVFGIDLIKLSFQILK